MHIDEFKDFFYKHTKNEPDKNRLRQYFIVFYRAGRLIGPTRRVKSEPKNLTSFS